MITLEMLQQGGWPMIPLAICSVIAAGIFLERLAALRRKAVMSPDVVELTDDYKNESNADAALRNAENASGPFARLVEEIFKSRHLNHAQVVETMHVTGRTQVGQMERGLTLLEIIANISPLLGLLGTVLGMVNVFDAISTDGLGDPQVLSKGISQALITTIAGLCVAIPALACHSWLSRKVDDYAAEMQERATALIAKLFVQRASAANRSGV